MKIEDMRQNVFGAVANWAESRTSKPSPLRLGDMPAIRVEYPLQEDTFPVIVVVSGDVWYAIVPNLWKVAQDGSEDYLLGLIAALNFSADLYRFGIDPATRELRMIVATAVPTGGVDNRLAEAVMSQVGAGLSVYLKSLKQFGKPSGISSAALTKRIRQL
jgi:hypothetical protein